MDDLLQASVLIFLPVVVTSAAFVVCFSVVLALLEGLEDVITNLKERR